MCPDVPFNRYWDDTDLMSKISAKLRGMNVSGPTPSAAADAAAAGKGAAGKGAGKVRATATRWLLLETSWLEWAPGLALLFLGH
jgi:hypothetical protein